MPYKSDAQRRLMHAKHPEIAARWDAEIRSKQKVAKAMRFRRLRHPQDLAGAFESKQKGAYYSAGQRAMEYHATPESDTGMRSYLQGEAARMMAQHKKYVPLQARAEALNRRNIDRYNGKAAEPIRISNAKPGSNRGVRKALRSSLGRPGDARILTEAARTASTLRIPRTRQQVLAVSRVRKMGPDASEVHAMTGVLRPIKRKRRKRSDG